eukprot:TRINITY_DN32836_c0_g1_i1.p1 TRINITY_DN32836_c0_g1~~TRINITY_DN32836_c0_g1_i1.p1  ORF type:complete len:193 (+),score=47.33 TRINITY_DN32836_c0_g1_i1:115-693(+)
MIRRPPRSTLSSSSAASDVYKRQHMGCGATKVQVDLHGAVQEDKLDQVQLVCATAPERVTLKDARGDTALHYAAEHNRAEMARMLLEAKADVSASGSEECTPLHIASVYGSSELVQILIQHKADLALTDAEGQTALHAATLYGEHEIVETLVAARADVNKKDLEGQTPLWTAKKNKIQAVIEILHKAGARND